MIWRMLPESAARKALRLPKPVVPSVTRESDLVPSVPATSIIQDKAKKVLARKWIRSRPSLLCYAQNVAAGLMKSTRAGLRHSRVHVVESQLMICII